MKRSSFLILPLLSLLTFPLASFAQSNTNSANAPTTCPQGITWQQAQNAGWESVLQGVYPADPLNCSGCTPRTINNYPNACGPYTSNQMPGFVDIFYPATSAGSKK